MHHYITDRPRVVKDLKDGGSHLFKRRSCYFGIFLMWILRTTNIFVRIGGRFEPRNARILLDRCHVKFLCLLWSLCRLTSQ